MLRYNQSITCEGYVHDGKADINYAINKLKLATEKEYSKAFEVLKRIYDDCELVVRKKINYDDLRCKAWKREATV